MTRIHGGTGLGRAIANPLVQQTLEQVWTETEVGKGTKLTDKIQQFTRSWPAALGRSGDARVSPKLSPREGLTGSAP